MFSFLPLKSNRSPVVFHRITSAPGSTTRRLIDSLTSELFTARFVSPPNRDIYTGRFRMAKQSQWRVTPAFVSHKYSPAKAQSPERVVSSRAVLAVSAYCLQHLTARRRASCSRVSSSLALRSVTLSCARRKDERVDYFTKHNCRRVSDNLCYFFLRNCEFARCAHFFFFFQPSVWSGALMLGVRTI